MRLLGTIHSDRDQADQVKNQAGKVEQQFDAYSADAKKKMEEMKLQAERELRAAGKEVNAAANKFDKTVIDKANESKGWVGGLFGGK